MQKYHEQVHLLISVLPHIEKEKCFALKGGTAINLFIRDMPRLSVDIDMQYVYFDERSIAIKNINEALNRISNSLMEVGIKTVVRTDETNIGKMICSNGTSSIKIEPNYVIRGCISQPTFMQNSLKVQEIYGFASINVLSFGELYGGKICAALDRQHPRDLFDIKYLLNTEGITTDVMRGFLVAVLSHNRPPHEILKPSIQNHESTFANEFFGMTEENFSYNDHQQTLYSLINETNRALPRDYKDFLISFFDANPNWNLVNADDKIQDLPAIKWKMRNLQLLKVNNIEKFRSQIDNLQSALS